MFKDAPVYSSFSVNDLAKAKDFYGQTLGLDVSDNAMGNLELKLSTGGGLMIYPKPNHAPATFTVLNFEVKDVRKAAKELKAKGIEFELYDLPGLKTDDDGIVANDDMKIAWFKDPAGNILAIIESGE